MLKIYQVTFNDGGWHSSLPSFQVVAESKDKAVEIARLNNKHYSTWEAWAYEFKIDGYVIEVYDEKTYNRDKNLEKLDI